MTDQTPTEYIGIDAEDALRRRLYEMQNAAIALSAENERLRAAMEKAVADYGKPGGPWNVPMEPGTWIAMATDALKREGR